MTVKLPSLNALRAFDAVARHRSYTKAARELNVTPAAVKQLVTKLEVSLGSQLVRRAGRDLVLTDAGCAGQENLLEGFRQMALAANAICREAGKERLLVAPFEETILTDIGYDIASTKQALASPQIAQFETWLLQEASIQPEWKSSPRAGNS